jgi:hypothetical protein
MTRRTIQTAGELDVRMETTSRYERSVAIAVPWVDGDVHAQEGTLLRVAVRSGSMDGVTWSEPTLTIDSPNRELQYEGVDRARWARLTVAIERAWDTFDATSWREETP